MNTEKIPSCLVWSVEDIDMLLPIDYIEELTKEQKKVILDIFFVHQHDIIVEFIYKRLEDFLFKQIQTLK